MPAPDANDTIASVLPEAVDLRRELQARRLELDAAHERADKLARMVQRADRQMERMRVLLYAARVSNAHIAAYLETAAKRPEWVRPDHSSIPDLPPVGQWVEVWLTPTPWYLGPRFATLDEAIGIHSGTTVLRWRLAGGLLAPLAAVEGWRRHEPPPWVTP